MGVAASRRSVYDGTFDLMAWILRALARNEAGYVLFNLLERGIALVMLPATFCAGMTLPLITYRLLRSPPASARSASSTPSTPRRDRRRGASPCTCCCWLGVQRRAPRRRGHRRGARRGAARRDGRRAPPLGAGASRGDRGHRRAGGAGRRSSTSTRWRSSSGVFRTGAGAARPRTRRVFHRDGKTATVDVIETQGDALDPDQRQARREHRLEGGPRADAGRDHHGAPGRAAAGPPARRKTAAVIGFGSGMTTTMLLASPPLERVDTVEIEPAMVEGARLFRPAVDRVRRPAQPHRDRRREGLLRPRRRTLRHHRLGAVQSLGERRGRRLFTEEFYARLAAAPERRRSAGPVDPHLRIQHPPARGHHQTARRRIADAAYRTGTDDPIIVATPRARVGEPSARIFEDPQLAARLERIGITSLADIETRRAAGRNPIEHYIADMPITSNSDYFPIVDLKAPRARFMGRSASEVIALTDGPMPLVEMLDRRPLQLDAPVSEPPLGSGRQQRTAAAEKWAAYLQTPQAGDGKPGSTENQLEESVAIARAIFIECAPKEVTSPLWDRMILVAAEITRIAKRHGRTALEKTRSYTLFRAASDRQAFVDTTVRRRRSARCDTHEPTSRAIAGDGRHVDDTAQLPLQRSDHRLPRRPPQRRGPQDAGARSQSSRPQTHANAMDATANQMGANTILKNGLPATRLLNAKASGDADRR